MSPSGPDPSSTYSDQDYITGVQHGDVVAFTALVRAHIDPLTRFAYGFTGTEEAAHDIVQDVFARIWELRTDWSPQGSIAAYLFASIRHRALNWIKANSANQRMRDAFLASMEQIRELDDPYNDVALTAAVHREVLRLTDRQREALRLRYEQGLTVPGVAEVLGIEVRPTEKLIARALGLLRSRLDRVRNAEE